MITDIKGEIAQTNVSRGGEGDKKFVRMMRDGSISVVSFIQAMIFEGKGYTASLGVLSTPGDGGGSAEVLDLDQPNFSLGIPDGTSIMLFRVTAQIQTPLLVTDADESEILLGVHVGTKIVVATATPVIPRSLKTGLALGSALDVQKEHSTNITIAPTLDIELARAVATGDMNGAPANALWGLVELNYEPNVIPIIKGAGTVLLYHGGTVATDAFAQLFWIEIATADLTG